ncbi:polysaccharide biosynthesis protein [Sphingopyxis kveilinensis]|uniref:polysaccharide biosynthesis protein n=1 Tax=Sphingopyxis kveilinensis TaxID=3114367 RepID=UPI0030D3B725
MAVVAVSLHLAVWLRASGSLPPTAMYNSIWAVTPYIALVGAVVHRLLGLQRLSWRYTSIYEFKAMIVFAAMMTAAMVLLLSFRELGNWRPRTLPFIFFMLTLYGFMGTRLARRLLGEYIRGNIFPPKPADGPQEPAEYTLFAGKGDHIELMLRANERRQIAGGKPLGILLSDRVTMSMRIRGVPVLGIVTDLAKIVEQQAQTGKHPTRIIFAETPERLREAPFLQMVAKAESLGLSISCLPELTSPLPQRRNDGSDTAPAAVPAQALRPIQLSDLLGRSQNILDYKVVENAITGRCVLVTGAGGTIGRELVRQIASFAPSRIILLESSEIALYEVDNEMKASYPDIERSAVLCCIRQRKQVMNAFKQFQPELVFHAAALKHVPIVELHPSAGVQTNVLGTRNVADAANRYGTRIMVQVSTDKAVNPIGMMGATKRLGELYCQALDLAGIGKAQSPRFLTVRFGNVLGSSGSLIPLFEKQLLAGGPLTVTHPEIERFFMTVSEAVQLVLQASARSKNVERGRIFVLDMGEPIKVLDIARRMIRLSGGVPDKDVMIKFVGLRPGEKLYEELFNESEQKLPSVLDGIFEAEPAPLPLDLLNDIFNRLSVLTERADDGATRKLVFQLLSEGEGIMSADSQVNSGADVASLDSAPDKVAAVVGRRISIVGEQRRYSGQAL